MQEGSSRKESLLGTFFLEYSESFRSGRQKTPLQWISWWNAWIYLPRCRARSLAKDIHCFRIYSRRRCAPPFLTASPSGHSPEFHLVPRAHFRHASCEISVARLAARLTCKRNSPCWASFEKRAAIFWGGCQNAVSAPWRSGSTSWPCSKLSGRSAIHTRPKMLALLPRNSFVSFRIIMR